MARVILGSYEIVGLTVGQIKGKDLPSLIKVRASAKRVAKSDS